MRIIFLMMFSLLCISHKLYCQTYRGAFDKLENQIYETYLSQLTQPSPHDFSVTTQVASDSIGTVKEKKWRWGIYVSPSLCYRTFSIENSVIKVVEINNNAKFQSIRYNNKWDTPKLGYSFGLNASYNIKHRFRIDFNLLFENMGYKTALIDTLFVAATYGPGSGVSSHDTLINQSKLKFNDYVISLPVMMEYTFYSGKLFSYYSGFGASYSLLISETEIRGNKYKTHPRTSLFFLRAALGGKWATSKMDYSFGPTFMYSLSSIPLWYNERKNLYTLGLAIKCNFK